MKELPASQTYRLLEPGPIVMVSTRALAAAGAAVVLGARRSSETSM